MNIKAAVAHARGAPLVIEGLVLDAPRDDEIVVRLVAAGVARIDQDAIDGILAMPLPFVPGSEGAGIVEHVGAAVTDLVAGDAVLVGYAFRSASAPHEAAGPRACLDVAGPDKRGRRADGSAAFSTAGDGTRPVNGFLFGQSSFATHLLCRARSAVKLSLGAPLEVLACLGGEVLLGAAAISATFDVQPGDTLVITGADAVGLVACMVARARGATTIIVADPDEARRTLASEFGATLAVNLDADLSMTAKSMVADGVRFAFDTTGHAAAVSACLDSLAPGGTCVSLQEAAAGDAVEPAGRTLLRAGDMQAASDGLISELVALYADGRLPIDRLIGFFPFDLVNDALDALATGAVVKPILRFPLGSFGDLDRALTEGAAKEADGPEADSREPTDASEPLAPPTAPVEA